MPKEPSEVMAPPEEAVYTQEQVDRDFVTRLDYETLAKQYNELKTNYSKIVNAFNKLVDEYNQLHLQRLFEE